MLNYAAVCVTYLKTTHFYFFKKFILINEAKNQKIIYAN